MVNISLIRKGVSYELYAKGHAGYSKKGEDIICAAISILLYTLVTSIDVDDLAKDPIVVMESGNTFIRIEPKKSRIQKIAGVFSVINNGFKILSENFPKNIRFFSEG